MPYKDPEQRRAYSRAYYAKYKRTRKQLKQGKDRAKQRGRLLLEEFRSDGCDFCDETDPRCLDAHHRDPETKEHSIATMLHTGYSVEAISKELAKCICVCANCHRKIHAEPMGDKHSKLMLPPFKRKNGERYPGLPLLKDSQNETARKTGRPRRD